MNKWINPLCLRGLIHCQCHLYVYIQPKHILWTSNPYPITYLTYSLQCIIGISNLKYPKPNSSNSYLKIHSSSVLPIVENGTINPHRCPVRNLEAFFDSTLSLKPYTNPEISTAASLDVSTSLHPHLQVSHHYLSPELLQSFLFSFPYLSF